MNDKSYQSGFRLFYRSMMDHPLVGFKKPFQNSEAWEWLMFSAWGDKEKPGDIYINNRLFRVSYGEMIYSIRFIAKAWGWGDMRVRKFLENLENLEMIERNITQQTTKITICNFGSYQNREHSKKQTDNKLITNWQRTDNTNTNTLTRKHVNTNKEPSENSFENKNFDNSILSDSKKKNPTAFSHNGVYSENFEKFWKDLPSQMKVGKKAAYQSYKNSVNNQADYERLKLALENYKNTDRFKRGKIQNGSTWFSNWSDWLEYREETKEDRRNRERTELINKVLEKDSKGEQDEFF